MVERREHQHHRPEAGVRAADRHADLDDGVHARPGRAIGDGDEAGDLDFLLDAKANTIGALLLHLAATETYYQLHTFQGMAWGAWPDAVKQKWEAASALGDAGRKTIKGKEPDYYLGVLKETRDKTLTELKKRDDKWLFAVDTTWPWGPTNNYCKWFHVCEHEANHNGRSSC